MMACMACGAIGWPRPVSTWSSTSSIARAVADLAVSDRGRGDLGRPYRAGVLQRRAGRRSLATFGRCAPTSRPIASMPRRCPLYSRRRRRLSRSPASDIRRSFVAWAPSTGSSRTTSNTCGWRPPTRDWRRPSTVPAQCGRGRRQGRDDSPGSLWLYQVPDLHVSGDSQGLGRKAGQVRLSEDGRGHRLCRLPISDLARFSPSRQEAACSPTPPRNTASKMGQSRLLCAAGIATPNVVEG